MWILTGSTSMILKRFLFKKTRPQPLYMDQGRQWCYIDYNPQWKGYEKDRSQFHQQQLPNQTYQGMDLWLITTCINTSSAKGRC
jgi:hypothetical protein